jgi:NTP pyrophosphatase (non-canonical NTP hydrolase)
MDQKDYLRDSERTMAANYFSDLVTAPHLDFTLQAVITSGAWADRVKRALFYGKEMPDARVFSMTSIQHRPEFKDLLHATLGCVTEAAEMAEHVLDILGGRKVLDRVNVIEELGDIQWYVALALRFVHSDFAETFETNIAKLRKRFPDKFTEVQALSRDLTGERAVLEESGKPSIADIEAALNAGKEVHLGPDGAVIMEQAEAATPYIPQSLLNSLASGAPVEPDTSDYAEVVPAIGVGAKWRHTSGRIYTVLMLTNLPDEERYPLTVVYQGENGKMWSRRADDWYRSMTLVPDALRPPSGTESGALFLLQKGITYCPFHWTSDAEGIWSGYLSVMTDERAARDGWSITGRLSMMGEVKA